MIDFEFPFNRQLFSWFSHTHHCCKPPDKIFLNNDCKVQKLKIKFIFSLVWYKSTRIHNFNNEKYYSSVNLAKEARFQFRYRSTILCHQKFNFFILIDWNNETWIHSIIITNHTIPLFSSNQFYGFWKIFENIFSHPLYCLLVGCLMVMTSYDFSLALKGSLNILNFRWNFFFMRILIESPCMYMLLELKEYWPAIIIISYLRNEIVISPVCTYLILNLFVF